MSAIADVARLAGVSKSTASRALSGRGAVSPETRSRVESAASQIGYVVSSNAASLVTGRTRNVGVVVPYVNRWFFGDVLEGIEAALIGAGYDLTLYRLTSDDEQRRRIFDYFLVRKRVDAVIAIGIELSSDEVRMLRLLRKPLVGIGGDIPGVATLSIDDVAASRFVTDHLIGLGHSRILHLGGEHIEQMDVRVHEQRLAGFRSAMASAGLGPHASVAFVPFSIEGGYRGALTALADPATRPTAIVAACDEIAIGVIVAARELGISVPSRLSVVGIDGHPLAEMFALTTLEQKPAAHGLLAVEHVLDRLAGGEPGDTARRVMPATLAMRGSTTAPPIETGSGAGVAPTVRPLTGGPSPESASAGQATRSGAVLSG
ncbi:LacI family DNA-binding transcriptional regulator [Marisediminicola sp. LYQ85]|uniref:LacI family DNA-binding transcriptional regulator n=1 Tax=Marisediminicola sp. LYQ85 TaxID=3391062 RepID=UPI00398369E6